jgi:transcriptional regulator
MSRHDALQGALPLLVLKILARRGPVHGYAIAVQIESMSNDVLRVEEGSLYPALHRMEEGGLIAADWTTTAANRRVRVYRVTKAGLAQLEADEHRWQAVANAVGHILKHA